MHLILSLCLLASAVTAQNLTTTFGGTNSHNGNMFDLTAINPVVISGFDVNLQSSGPQMIEVWTVTGGGTFVGKETNAAAWTLVGSAPVESAGSGVATVVPIPVNTPIAAGGRQGFYVTCTSGFLNYSNGTGVGNPYVSDANLVFHEGVGKGYPFGSTYAPRIWNGVIRYVPAPTASLTTTFSGGNGQNGNMFDVVALRDIAVHGFDVNIAAGTWNFVVYAVDGGGTFVGKENNAMAWVLVGSATGVVSAGSGAPTTLPLATNVLVRVGQTQGFYVTCANGAVAYSNGTAVGNVYSQNADVQLLEGIGITYPFGTSYSPRVWNGNLKYTTVPVSPATVTSLGSACGHEFRSFYEEFSVAAPYYNTFDLNGLSMRWQFAGTRYIVDDVVAAFVPPSAAAINVAAGVLDGEQGFTLSAPMPTLGGATTTLQVCTKGYVATAAGNVIDYTPSGLELLAFPNDTWACWMDYDQTHASSGKILYEQVGNIAYVTWNGVWSYYDNPATNTFQFQFNVTTGDVTLVVVALNGSSLWPCVVGFSPGGSILNPGRTDISAALAAGTIITDPLDRALHLVNYNTPVLGTTWSLGVGNIPATGLLGVEILGFFDPGIDDLGFLGMPLCGLRASPDLLTPWFVSSSIHYYDLPVPNNLQLMGLDLFTTTAVFQVPPINAFGAITSRGLQGHIGSY